MKEAINRLLDWFFPPKCAACETVFWRESGAGALCPACADEWKRETAYYADNERGTVAGIRWLLYLTKYRKGGNSVGSRMILHAKHHCSQLYLDFMADAMQKMLIQQLDFSRENTVLVYVPRSAKARRKASFDQCRELSRVLSRKMKLPMYSALRHFGSKEQKKLAAADRWDNARLSYSLIDRYKTKLKGKHVLLLDDVLTSGASASACAQVLHSAGADIIDMIVIGRTSRAAKKEETLEQFI